MSAPKGGNSKSFKLGDPRINRKGPPTKDNSMRAILEDIGRELEIIKDKSGKKIKLTKKQLLAKKMFIEAMKGNYQYTKLVTAYTDGEPERKNINELTGPDGEPFENKITIEFVKSKK